MWFLILFFLFYLSFPFLFQYGTWDVCVQINISGYISIHRLHNPNGGAYTVILLFILFTKLIFQNYFLHILHIIQQLFFVSNKYIWFMWSMSCRCFWALFFAASQERSDTFNFPLGIIKVFWFLWSRSMCKVQFWQWQEVMEWTVRICPCWFRKLWLS